MRKEFWTLRILGTGAIILSLFASCGKKGWSAKEMDIINAPGAVMRVLTVEDMEDSLTLRQISQPLTDEMICCREYAALCDKMVATVTSPDQDGVGIAGPQIGISRRIVALQRFDKAGEPFEVYPNIRILSVRRERIAGSEGCLSVPGRRGTVERFLDIDIAYTSPKTLCDTTERIEGFTAVIFQHECDHLDGILYTDYSTEP